MDVVVKGKISTLLEFKFCQDSRKFLYSLSYLDSFVAGFVVKNV